MSKIDRVKEEVGCLKLVLGINSVLDASLVAWIAQHFKHAQTGLLLASMVGVIVLTAGLLWTARLMIQRLQELEEL